jgi:RES domain-containing protein
LRADWRRSGHHECAELGSKWLRSRKSLVLFVPSAVNPLERNAIINPEHAEIARCAVGDIIDVKYDERLLALFHP